MKKISLSKLTHIRYGTIKGSIKEKGKKGLETLT